MFKFEQILHFVLHNFCHIMHIQVLHIAICPNCQSSMSKIDRCILFYIFIYLLCIHMQYNKQFLLLICRICWPIWQIICQVLHLRLYTWYHDGRVTSGTLPNQISGHIGYDIADIRYRVFPDIGYPDIGTYPISGPTFPDIVYIVNPISRHAEYRCHKNWARYRIIQFPISDTMFVVHGRYRAGAGFTGAAACS